MSRWLLGIGASTGGKLGQMSNDKGASTSGSEVTRCYGTGSIVRHPQLVEQEDCDNALGVIEYANGSKTTLHLSRTGMGGYSSVVEVFGTEQKLEVGVSMLYRFQRTSKLMGDTDFRPRQCDRRSWASNGICVSHQGPVAHRELH